MTVASNLKKSRITKERKGVAVLEGRAALEQLGESSMDK
jgi:hypothetical protein